MNRLILLFFCSVILISCSKDKHFEVTDFNPITNFKDSLIELDYSDAIDSGFVIPTVRQTADGMFHFEFNISNNGEKAETFFYKIYYQNESYKFSELDSTGKKYNALAEENFYGSWEDVKVGFIPTPEIPNDGDKHSVKGSFRIVGNPRSEEKYFGILPEKLKIMVSEEEIKAQMKQIDVNTEWSKSIREKAYANKLNYEQQLRLDAIYMVEQSKLEKLKLEQKTNQRWKRNPRVGEYSFLLVVTTLENIKENKLPKNFQNIGESKGGLFVSPYYISDSLQNKLKNYTAIKVSKGIKVKAHPNLGSGIYIDEENFKPGSYDPVSFKPGCGNNKELKKNAAFAQYSHWLTASAQVNNLPITADIFSENYSKKEYEENLLLLDKKRVQKPIHNTKCPCETVVSDPKTKSITIKNPASKEGEFKKESVGIISRNGFTYGKYIVKAKLTPLMNAQNVWNGITNAIWLINQSKEEWNNRRICKKEGFMPGYHSTKADTRVPQIAYSEIDFEILKASHRWPQTSYKKGTTRPANSSFYDDKIMVTCTNWDMACFDPKKFDVGVHPIQYDNQFFNLHRWDHWYNAVTLKNPQKEDDLFSGPYYYFEIEWTPTEIIWRIGPEKNKMKVVGYMNNEVTTIPNNQMLMIVTQEFHVTSWWPEAPFSQDNIPFPKNDYLGYILDFEIE